GLYVYTFPIFANHPAVAGRVVKLCRENCHRGTFQGMKIAQFLDGSRSYQGSIAGEHDYLVIWRQSLARYLQGMTRAMLLGLQDKADARVRNGLPDAIRLMANHSENVLHGNDVLGGSNNVSQQRLPADLVQHLGMFRSQSRSLAGRHNENGNTRSATGGVGLGFWHSIQYTARGQKRESLPAGPYKRSKCLLGGSSTMP